MTKHIKVLIVEDNDLNLKLLQDFLEYQKYLVYVAREGQAAIEIVHQQRPDLVLLDMQLPVISGIEVLRRLKQNPETAPIPIIAVTAFAMREDRANFLALGCDDYISKPFKLSELLELIQRYTTPDDTIPDSPPIRA
jgi:two-component system cell cycle response regulator DivK